MPRVFLDTKCGRRRCRRQESESARGFSLWDSLILECSAVSGCGVLYTEDLQDGQTVRGVEIRNPFRDPVR